MFGPTVPRSIMDRLQEGVSVVSWLGGPDVAPGSPVDDHCYMISISIFVSCVVVCREVVQSGLGL